MNSLPLSDLVIRDWSKNIRLVATDMDGTLTKLGKFTAKLLQALENLAAAGLPVLIVTGRSAGWTSGLAAYLPVIGVIAENGGLFYPGTGEPPLFLISFANIEGHRNRLATFFDSLKAEFNQIQESSDNRFRLTDWTFDIEGLTPADLQRLSIQCYDRGWGFTYSSVQCHIKPASQDKATGLLQLLSSRFPDFLPAGDRVLTVGDSPNDESLFNAQYFPMSVGVANVLEYSSQLAHRPAFVTRAAEGDGFCELAQFLIEARNQI